MRKLSIGFGVACLIVASIGLANASTPIFSAHTGSLEERVAHLESAVRQLSLDTNHHLVVVAHTGQTQQPNQQTQHTTQQPNNNEPNGNNPNSPNTNPPNTNDPNAQPPNTQQPNTQPVVEPTPTEEPEPKPECTEGERRHGEWQDIGRTRFVYQNGVGYDVQRQWQQREQCINGKWKEVSAGQRDQKTRRSR